MPWQRGAIQDGWRISRMHIAYAADFTLALTSHRHMTYIFPTYLHLSVVRASGTMSLDSESDSAISSESFSLVLRAAHDTNVVLSSGEQLADVEIHLTLSTKWRTANELDQDLTNDDVGFLAHTNGERGEPFVHGAALLADTTVVGALLAIGTEGRVKLVLSSVPIGERTEAPFVWGTNRPNMLRISHLEVSVFPIEAGQREG